MGHRTRSQVIQDRNYARARRVRRDARSVRRGWPQFRNGAILFAIGVGITGFTLIEAPHSGWYVVDVSSIFVGILQMARGLGNLGTMKKIEALQAPLAEQKPWLFAPAAFSADGSAAAPAWFDDPLGSGGLRFWDGQNWTADTRPR